jgi:hypothetical protein
MSELKNTLALAEYRAGNWLAAKQAIQRSLQLARNAPDMAGGLMRLDAGGVGSVYDWLIMAMIEWQMGRQDEARHWYRMARSWRFFTAAKGRLEGRHVVATVRSGREPWAASTLAMLAFPCPGL